MRRSLMAESGGAAADNSSCTLTQTCTLIQRGGRAPGVSVTYQSLLHPPMSGDRRFSAERGIRSAQIAILVNAGLAIAKLVAGLVGNTYALVADAVESTADIFSSTIVWGGLRLASRDPDEDYPSGYGRAEPLAAAVVAIMLLGAAVGIALEAVKEIRTPHHLSDAVTSAAAFVGISIALRGGPGWESADDWAALLASSVIAFNGASMLRPALHDLMDRTPGAEVVEPVRRAAEGVPGVLATEKLAVRRSGMGSRVTVHVQADGRLPLDEAHVLGGKVKGAIRAAVPQVQYVLVHMEPYEGARAPAAGGTRRSAR